MSILNVIRKRTSIRKYRSENVPERIVRNITEAGIWGPSLLAPGFQPWRFTVITNAEIKAKIAAAMMKKADTIGAGGNIILRLSANTILNAPLIIVVHNAFSVAQFVSKLRKMYVKYAHAAELCAIAAAIQNMVLCAQELGLGTCWLDTPLFCRHKINRILQRDEELVAIVTVGYPLEKGKRAPRKPVHETVSFVK